MKKWFLLFLFSIPVFAEDTYVFSFQKSEQKQKSRWSLSEWIDQRDRMRMMDLWLALHTPTPYEFFVGGAYQVGKNTEDAYYSAWNLHLAAYAKIFGLEFQREMTTTDNRTLGLFKLRIFGYHSQGTNITLEGGVRNTTNSSINLWNPVFGASLTMCVSKYFGVTGIYRRYFSANDGSTGLKLDGNRYEAEAFIDFNFFRVYGGYFYELESVDLTGAGGNFIRKGLHLGARIYF